MALSVDKAQAGGGAVLGRPMQRIVLKNTATWDAALATF